MSGVDANVKLIKEHYGAIWSGDEAALRRQVSPDFVDHGMPPGTPKGVDTVIAWGKTIRAAFPDMNVTIHQTVAAGDRVAVHATWHGTHKGTFMGFAPTGKTISFDGMVFWRVADGKIAERWAVLDSAAMQRQLQA